MAMHTYGLSARPRLPYPFPVVDCRTPFLSSSATRPRIGTALSSHDRAGGRNREIRKKRCGNPQKTMRKSTTCPYGTKPRRSAMRPSINVVDTSNFSLSRAIRSSIVRRLTPSSTAIWC